MPPLLLADAGCGVLDAVGYAQDSGDAGGEMYPSYTYQSLWRCGSVCSRRLRHACPLDQQQYGRLAVGRQDRVLQPHLARWRHGARLLRVNFQLDSDSLLCSFSFQ